MVDTKARIKEVLDKGYLISLATADEGGVWAADLIYVFDEKDFTIYWMSRPEARHSKALEKNKNVAGTITVNNTFKEPDLGLQLTGTAERHASLSFPLSVKYLLKQGKPAPLKGVSILKEGCYWYSLRPTKIELIDEANLKFEKRTLAL